MPWCCSGAGRGEHQCRVATLCQPRDWFHIQFIRAGAQPTCSSPAVRDEPKYRQQRGLALHGLTMFVELPGGVQRLAARARAGQQLVITVAWLVQLLAGVRVEKRTELADFLLRRRTPSRDRPMVRAHVGIRHDLGF